MNLQTNKIMKQELARIKTYLQICNTLPQDQKIEFINEVKKLLHEISPFKNEPVDCVLWVKNESVVANDYNPNSVMPPEMELLKVSIEEDGYTQPIVTMANQESREVVDGFHRNRVGKEYPEITARVHGYLPVVTINEHRTDKGDRMAATIRHNRARGKHSVIKMSEIVSALIKRNWSYDKISKKLGMEPDEVLRLSQITGLAEMFADKDFSQAWEAETFD
jgi:ParB-like chromosome segregation protein Spo0J